MGYLIFILITIWLLGGFFALVRYEERRGVRVFAEERDRLDTNVARATFILGHVDLAAFLRDELRRALTRFGHAVAHLSLQAVRAVETLLTRLVRHLRAKHPVETAPREESVRPFVKTLADFKSRLKATHPEISDIQ